MGGEEIMGMALGGIVFMIPIVAILTHHQRKMAEIVHRPQAGHDPAVIDEVLKLRTEVNQLRAQIQETTIALDDLRGIKSSLAKSEMPSIPQRLGDQS